MSTPFGPEARAARQRVLQGRTEDEADASRAADEQVEDATQLFVQLVIQAAEPAYVRGDSKFNFRYGNGVSIWEQVKARYPHGVTAISNARVNALLEERGVGHVENAGYNHGWNIIFA